MQYFLLVFYGWFAVASTFAQLYIVFEQKEQVDQTLMVVQLISYVLLFIEGVKFL